jgi:hypothetical protein
MSSQEYVASGYVNTGYYQTGLSIDWETKVIFVPKFYLTHISGTTYQLDTNQFRIDLKNIEESTEGIVFEDTHRHNTEVVLSGITYARVIEFINGYTITFEDGKYAVNLVGSNNNIADVLNLNQVSIRASNSAGLQIVNTTGGVGTATEVANAVWDAALSAHSTAGTMGASMAAAGSAGDPWTTNLSTYNTAGTAGKTIKDILAKTNTLETEISNVPSAVRTELTPELTHILLLENGLTPAQATLLTEIYTLYGLDPTKPLIVTDTSRTAGPGITQTINSNSSSTTITRT